MNDVNHPPLLEAVDVSKNYGTRSVLRQVSLRVAASSIVGICGENGAGKSTLLRILMGLLAPDAGAVHCHVRRGYCPQFPAVFDQLTVEEHFRYFAQAYAGDLLLPEVLRSRVDMLTESLHLHHCAGQRVATLSGGTRQKLNLALALLHDPSVVILDEPYAGFDWETYRRFWTIARDLREVGKAVLIVSHLVFDHTHFDSIHTLAQGKLTCSCEN